MSRFYHLNASGKSSLKAAGILSWVIVATVFLFFAMLRETETASEENTDYVVGPIHDVSYQYQRSRDQIYFRVNGISFVMEWLGRGKDGPNAANDLREQTGSVCVMCLSNRRLWGKRIAISVQTSEKQYGDLARFNREQRTQRGCVIALFLILWAFLLFGLGLSIYFLYQEPRPHEFSGVLGFFKWLFAALSKQRKR